MALKTALRRLCKWLPQTVEMARAQELDERSLTLSSEMIADGGFPARSDDDGVIDAEVVE